LAQKVSKLLYLCVKALLTAYLEGGREGSGVLMISKVGGKWKEDG
jgi:hypothetical protein